MSGTRFLYRKLSLLCFFVFFPLVEVSQWKHFILKTNFGVNAALNIYPNLGETLVDVIDDHLLVDYKYTAHKEAVSSTCTSLDMLPCWSTADSIKQLQRNKNPMLLFYTTLGDLSDSEPLWTILADGVSWLIAQESVIADIGEDMNQVKKVSFQSSEPSSPKPLERWRASNITQSNFSGSQDQRLSVFSFFKFWNLRNFSLHRLGRFLSGSFTESLNSLVGYSNSDERFSIRLSKLKGILGDARSVKHALPEHFKKGKDVTLLDEKKKEEKTFRDHIIWTIPFHSAPQGVLPEFFGSIKGTTSETSLMLRWVGNWTTTKTFLQQEETWRNVEFVHGKAQHIFFSKPVLVSEFCLIRLESVVESHVADTSLVVEGWVWNVKARQRFAFLQIPEQTETWFFQLEPLDLVRQRQIVPLWRLRLSLKNIPYDKPLNIISHLTATPYVRLDGITISENRGNGLVALASMTLHRVVLKKGEDDSKSQVNSTYRAGIVLREIGESREPLLNKFVFPLKNLTQGWDIQAIEKANRDIWKTQMKKVLMKKKQWNLVSSWDMYSISPETVDFHIADFLSRMSSDGIFYDWDNRSPMRSLLFLLQRRLPIEAPVISFKQLDKHGRLIRRRPILGTNAQQLFVYDYPPNSVENEENEDDEWNIKSRFNSVFEGILVKRRLIRAARSAAQMARRLQNIYNEIGPHKDHFLKQENITHEQTEKMESFDEEQESLSHFFREELFRSLKEAMDRERQEHHTTGLESSTESFEKSEYTSQGEMTTALKEITIAEISNKDLKATRRYRFNLVTGEIITEGDVVVNRTISRGSENSKSYNHSTLI